MKCSVLVRAILWCSPEPFVVVLCTQVVFAADAGISFTPFKPLPTPPHLLLVLPHSECSSLKQTAALTAAYRDRAAALTWFGILVTGAAFTH